MLIKSVAILGSLFFCLINKILRSLWRSNMLNVYNYHVHPVELYDYENHWKADPMLAVEVLQRYPDRKDVLALVLSSPRAIIKHVQDTRKPFPEGLRVLLQQEGVGATSTLIDYAVWVESRVPEIEKRILSLGHIEEIFAYISRVIKGVWKEAESTIGKESYYRREYVRLYLNGDWSKFDEGQYKEDNDWIGFVQGLLDDGVTSYDENAEAMAEEDWDDEDEEAEPYEPLDISYRDWSNKKGFDIYRGLTKVGSIGQVRSGKIELLDKKEAVYKSLELGKPEDAYWDDVYDYIHDVIVSGI